MISVSRHPSWLSGSTYIAVDAGRHMDPIDTMRRTGPSDHIAPIDGSARGDHDLRQIAQRYLESGNRLDGHRSHPGNRAGERDPARGRRPYRVPGADA